MTDKYIHPDSHGVYQIQDTRVSLDSVVAGFHRGDSPESIRSQYSVLTLEQVYGAITFYLANREHVDEYLRRQDEVWEYWRKKSEENPPLVVQRLRAMRGASAV